MTNSYLRPAGNQEFVHEWELKRSRFITTAARVRDEEEARAFISRIKERYPDATHNCSAYYLFVEQASPIERSSDDGEPSGTAGKPMLEQLKGSGLLDIAAVVTRYYGGVKLGAGGLVHAYSESVGLVLPSITRVQRRLRELYTIDLDHAEAGRIEADLRARGVEITDVAYGAKVHLTLGIDPGTYDGLADLLASATSGTVTAKDAGITWIEN